MKWKAKAAEKFVVMVRNFQLGEELQFQSYISNKKKRMLFHKPSFRFCSFVLSVTEKCYVKLGNTFLFF